MKDFSYNNDMEQLDPVRTLILRRVNEIEGASLSDLSKQIGKNHAYLQQFVTRGVPANLPEQVRTRLAPLIHVDESSLRGQSTQRGMVERSQPQNARMGGGVALRSTIPVYGHAVGGRDGQFILNGNKVTDILAPPSLAGILEAYAVYIVGESMVPRYYPGEAAFVNPRLPVRRGDFVVAQISTGQDEAPYAYVKRFVMRDNRRLRLEQFNPKKTLEFPDSSVVSVHRIIMGGDG